jgi:hypothetical protein
LKKIFQKSWLGIDFNTLSVNLSRHDIANEEFYTEFYKTFFRKFRDYSDLPSYWIEYKNEIVDHLKLLLKPNDVVLSIGAGLCYIESKLVEDLIGIDLTAIEPNAMKAHEWMNPKIQLIKGYFPADLKLLNFDFVYSSSIDYIFNDDQYLEFLNSLTDYGINDYFITEIYLDDDSTISKIKDFTFHSLDQMNLVHRGQFWGYLRTFEEHFILLKKAGFKTHECGLYKHGAGWIRATL